MGVIILWGVGYYPMGGYNYITIYLYNYIII
jgi:hypothetical protein